MIIDKNGIIEISDLGLRIGPDFTLDEFKNNTNFPDFKFWGSNENYERYGKRHLLINNLQFSALLIFYKNRISQISINYTELTDKVEYEDVENYKEQADLTKRKHDEWLIREHGATQIKYTWGTIGSYLDTRFQYTARIDIQYNNVPINPRPALDKNGIAYIETLGVKISRDFKLKELKNKEPNECIKYYGSNGGYEWYAINDTVNEWPYSFLLLFKKNKIEFINIYYPIKITDKPIWEIKPMKVYCEMLLDEYNGGHKMEFFWGYQGSMRPAKPREGQVVVYKYKRRFYNIF